MHLLAATKRDSTRSAYADGRKPIETFSTELGVPLFPAAPIVLMDFVVQSLSAGLDSSTIKNRLTAVGDLYDYCRVHLRMVGLKNPLRDSQLVAVLRTLGVNYKKAGSGSVALTVTELHALYHRGFLSGTRRARWARLFFMFLNFGMLRHTAVQALNICYVIDNGSVRTLPESDVQVVHHAQYGGTIIQIRVDSDKNMNALKASQDGGRFAYIPGSLPLLDLEPAHDLLSYLARETPPSGGRLFVYPDKKGRGFAFKKCTTYNTYLKSAYRAAFPDSPPDSVSRLGSHSGRKTLANMLWNAGFARRLIADAGGWFLKREAIDLYFKTAPYMILQAIASLTLDGSSTVQHSVVASRHD
jgi:hypothetical protein